MIPISVIMPVYNSEKYLSKAIESVLNQTFKEFELILIDDGSKDKSPLICDEYANKDSRVKVIHQANGGICVARNKGLECAKGEYLAFIDNDDLYLPDLLEENYSLAKRHNADILKYGYRYIKHKKFSPEHIYSKEKLNEKNVIIIQKEKLVERYKLVNESNLLVYVWDGLFKAELIRKHKINFDISFKYGHEDRVFCIQLYQYVNCMVVNPKIYYCHIEYKMSTSKIFSLDRITDTEKLLAYEYNLFKVMNINQIHQGYWLERVLQYMMMIISFIRRPESSLKFDENLAIIQAFRKKYYFKEEIQQTQLKEKRLKNKIYVWLFQHDFLKILTYGLLLDRKFKYIVYSIKNRKLKS